MRFPANAYHDAVIVRNASFARILPKLVIKFARIPALFGGLMVGGVAWIQYQAIRKDSSSSRAWFLVNSHADGKQRSATQPRRCTAM